MLLGVPVYKYVLALIATLLSLPLIAHLPENFANLSEDVQSVILEYVFFSEEAHEVWGDDYEEPTAHHLVKYLDDYHTKVNIDFAGGRIRVESERSKTPIQSLQNAIVATLLTPANPNAVDLYTAADMGLTGKPFLSGLVLDHDGKKVLTQWRAERYAQYITANRMKNSGARYWVDIPMVRKHKQRSANNYQPLVKQASQRYQVEPALIYAIMETESSFNPFAVSPVGAYGLMQVMQNTAGRDVFEKIYQKRGKPSRKYLMDPARNIDAGTAYITILRDRYLRGITHPLTLEYCIVTSYNGGSGNLLKAFHKDRRKAMARINRMSPRAVYNHILRHHPYEESRNYLRKVMASKKNYAF